MIVLGIESTAHTFGVAIFNSENKKFLSNVRDSYSTKSGGIIPTELAEHHVNVCDMVLKRALSESGLSLPQIDLIAFSQSPGLGHALRIGAAVAKSLVIKTKKPLIGVNHCVAHLEIGRLLFPECKDPILVYASGANTQIIAYESGKYRIFGETLDMGIGNFIDSFARLLNLGFPGGPKVEELAKKGKLIELPYTVKGMDVTFGGLFSYVRSRVDTYSKEDLCYSVQEIAFAALLEVAERALAHTGKKEILLGGGVACNKRLQEMSEIMCSERGAKSYCPSNEFLVDNAAMIAYLGSIMFESGQQTPLDKAKIKPYERTDEVRVTWR